MPDLVVAGAGMAGLVAAAEATAGGARVVVHENGGRPGGSMLLSSGVIWRHRELADFVRECPGGTPALQQLVHALPAQLETSLPSIAQLEHELKEPTTATRPAKSRQAPARVAKPKGRR